MKAQTYEITVAARGEVREGADVLSYDLEPGPVPDDLDPRILARLVRRGVAVPVETKER